MANPNVNERIASPSFDLKIEPPQCLSRPLIVPPRLLMGPGPSNASQRVLQALSNPLLGHLHPEFIEIMDEVKEGLRYMFQTKCQNVFCISGTGHAGMDAIMVNLLEPNDVILIAKNGIWGERASDMASRQDGDVRLLEKPAGEVFSLLEIEEGLIRHRPSILFVVHVESSTGALQPIEGIGELCRKYETLLVVDTVASLGGVPFQMDEWGVDVGYTGSQKVLSCPPSLAPIALTDRAMSKVKHRKFPPRSYYFDFNHLTNYWGCDQDPRRYHHTGPISSIYALREGLASLSDEGLERFWQRHSSCAKRLQDGLRTRGLQLFVEDSRRRAPTVTTIKVPEGVQWKAVTEHMMQKHKVEMSGGLGPTAGQVWRIGLLGENCSAENVDLVLEALSEALSKERKKRSQL